MNNQITNLFRVLKELREHKQYPAISILMPAASTIPDKLKDRIQCKDLADQARDMLLVKHSAVEVEPLLKRVYELIENHDFTQDRHGLALFASGSFAELIPLPFSVETYVGVGDSFHVVGIVRELSKGLHYWVLTITKNMCKLYEAYNRSLHEVVTPLEDKRGNPMQGFPLDYIRPNDSLHDAIGKGDLDSRYLEDHEKRYFNVVDDELGRKLLEKSLPVIVVGVQKNLSMFRALTKHAGSIIGYQHGDFHSTHELSAALEPVVKAYHDEEAKRMISEFIESEGLLRQVFGIDRVWRMAQEGRIHCLLLEDGLMIPGVKNEADRMNVLLTNKPLSADGVIDLLDPLIGQVFATRGEVFCVPKDALKDFGHIGAILRY